MARNGDELVQQLCESALGFLAPAELPGLSVGRAVGTELVDLLYASDEVAEWIWELHQTLGEGPGILALSRKTPVLSVDLSVAYAPDAGVVFATEAQTRGVRTLWCVPLGIGAVTLGLLTLHGSREAPTTDKLISQVLVFSDALTTALLSHNHPVEASTESAIESEGDALVHQAAGMVMVQLRVELTDALGAMRAKAFGSGKTIKEVARDVVERRLRFKSD